MSERRVPRRAPAASGTHHDLCDSHNGGPCDCTCYGFVPRAAGTSGGGDGEAIRRGCRCQCGAVPMPHGGGSIGIGVNVHRSLPERCDPPSTGIAISTLTMTETPSGPVGKLPGPPPAPAPSQIEPSKEERLMLGIDGEPADVLPCSCGRFRAFRAWWRIFKDIHHRPDKCSGGPAVSPPGVSNPDDLAPSPSPSPASEARPEAFDAAVGALWDLAGVLHGRLSCGGSPEELKAAHEQFRAARDAVWTASRAARAALPPSEPTP